MGGAPTITATVKHRLCLDDLWTDKVYATFRGEKYFVKNTPSSSKSNDDARYEHSVELLSEREILNHVYFIDAVQGDSSIDIYKSNSTTVVFFGDITEFVARLNASLSYFGLDYTVVIDEGITSDEKQVSITDKYFLSALQEIFNIYELAYYFVGKTIHVGFTENAITFPMAYGADGALLSISKENANYQIINSITGVGSTDNIPYYYPNESDDRDAITSAGKKWITPQSNLMPPIYRESEGADMFYDAKNNTYQDPEGEYYEFENEYSEDNPQQGKVSFPEIKPTIKGMTNAAGQRIDTFIEFAYDRDDNEDFDPDNNNEYLHPYFFAKLRKTDGPNGFNLFDHAIENQPMQIAMTSGVCGACVFEIGVGDNTNKNTVQVDDQGNLLRDENGDVRCGREGKPEEVPQDRQNNTQTNEVWIALRKDDSTYAQLMPNKEYNYRPSANDTFVILGINLPQGYITRAEQELEDSLIKHMWMNNREKFNFSIKFSRIFFAEHPEVLEQLNENARLLIEYNNQQFTFYVDSFSYKMDSNIPLPEVSVDLVETLTVGQNSLQNALDSVKQDILSSIGGADFLKQGLKYFIRKDISDYVRGITTFLNGLRIQGKYISDVIMSPEQLKETDDVIMSVLKAVNTFIRKDKADATNFLLKLVGGAEFGNYEARKSGGKVDAQGAAELLSLLVRGLVTASGIESADFSTGALGTGFTLKIDENGDSYIEVDRMLVRKVATFVELLIQKIRAVGGQIILSPATMNCSRVEEHDTFYRCFFENTDGEKTIAQEFVVGDQARCQTFNVKEGVNENVTNTYYWRLVVGVGDDYIDLSKTDCDAGSTVPQAGDDIVQLGNRTDATRQAAIVLAAYGNDAPYFKMYRGIDSYSLSGKEFISFSRTEVMIIADSLRFSTGESVKDYIDNATGNAITGVDVEYALGDSPTEAPQTGWSTTAPEWQAGKYMWQRTKTTTPKGVSYSEPTCIQGAKGDTGKGVSALEEQYYLSTSNTTQTGGTWQTTCPAWESGKYIWTRTKVTWTDNTVTYTTPVLAEDINDLGAKLEQAISDLAENIDFVNSLSEELGTVKDQVDGAIETWFYDPVPTLTNAPASSWTTTELKNQHLGDLYYDGNGKAYRFQMSGSNYVWQVITDTDITKALANAQKAQDTADGKRRVFVTTPTNASAYDVGDLWVNATYGSYSNDLLRCKTAKAAGAAWNISHWEKASKYTDDTKANQAIADAAEALAAANDAQDTANAAKERLDGWAADNVISPTEKQALKDEIARIDGDKSEITENYTKYGLGTPTAYNNAHSAYRAVLVTLSAATPETIAIPSDFATKQTAYYTARTDALTAIADAAKAYVDSIEIGARNYILNTKNPVSATPQNRENFVKVGDWVIKKEAATIGDYIFTAKLKFENCTFIKESVCWFQTMNQNGWGFTMLGQTRLTPTKNGEYTFQGKYTWNKTAVTGNSEIGFRVDYVDGGTVTISEMRLYKGTKDVGWTPAPEDAENALNDYKEEVEAKFEATNESITAAVESSKSYTDEKGEHILSETTSMIEVAKGEINLSVDTKIGNLQIGGRNYFGFNKNVLLASINVATTREFDQSIKGVKVTLNANATPGAIIFRIQRLGMMDTGYYTFSSYMKASQACSVRIDICDSIESKAFSLTTDYQRIVFTGNVTKYVNDGYYNGVVDFSIPAGISLPSGTILYLKDIKIEKGTKATDWTPAPEDTDASITELSSRIEVTEESIKNTVSKTEFNELGDVVSNHTSQITQLNNQITSKVSSSELTEKLKGYVTTTTYNNKMSSIDQSLSSITSRVSSTETEINTIDGELQDITERVSAAELKITDDAIRATVESQTKQIADEAVADLLIGGTNLVKGSATRNFAADAPQGTFIYSANADTSVPAGMVVQIKCTVGSGTTGFYSGPYVCVNGKRYTWSFYARANRAHTVSTVGFENGGQRSIALTTTRQRFTHTFTANSNGYKAFTFYNGWQSGDIVYIDSFKLEEGDKATDWDAHPDDAKVQGDNLLPGTKDFDGWRTVNSCVLDTSMMYQGLTPTKATSNYGYKGYDYTFVSGKFYTLSGWVRANVANTVIVFFAGFTSAGQGRFTIPSANTWYRFVYCFKCGDADHAAGTKTVRLESGSNISSSRPLWVCGLKLEEGITPSPWTTALSEYSTTSEIKSSFEMTANGISLLGQEITLTGKVTFSMLASDAQNKVTTAQNTATSAQNKANSVDSALSSLKNDLGDLAYTDKVSDAMLDETVIVGGYLKTSLIDVDNLYVRHLEGATGDFTGEVSATSGQIGNWIIDGGALRSSDFDYPDDPTSGNGAGSRLSRSGLMVTCSGNETGVLVPSSGSKLAASIVAKGTNSWVQGAYIGAENTSTYGYLSTVVALELKAKNNYAGTPQDKPLALKVSAGFCDIPGVLVAGSVSREGVRRYAFGKKGIPFTVTFPYGGYDQYRIVHNLGHTRYTVQVTPYSIGLAWRKYHAHVAAMDANSFCVVFVDSGTEGSLVQSEFAFAVIGDNN